MRGGEGEGVGRRKNGREGGGDGSKWRSVRCEEDDEGS